MVFQIHSQLFQMHLGKNEESRIDNLVAILDGYFAQGAHHLNVNVLKQRNINGCYGKSR